MNPGTLRHRITLQSPNAGQDDTGQPVHTYADFATVYADVRYVGGLEAIKSGVPVGVQRASVRIRWLPGVVSTMRVLHGGVVFDIKSVQPDPTGRVYIDLVCESGAHSG